MLTSLLGGGISSRLFRRVREEHGLVYQIGAEYHAYGDAGLLVVEGSTSPEHLLAVLELTLMELVRFLMPGERVDDEEVWKVKMGLRGQHLLGAEDTHTRMSRLATQEYYFARSLPPEEVLGAIEGVQAPQVEALAEELFGAGIPQAILAVVGPEAPESYRLVSLESLLGQFGYQGMSASSDSGDVSGETHGVHASSGSER